MPVEEQLATRIPAQGQNHRLLANPFRQVSIAHGLRGTAQRMPKIRRSVLPADLKYPWYIHSRCLFSLPASTGKTKFILEAPFCVAFQTGRF